MTTRSRSSRSLILWPRASGFQDRGSPQRRSMLILFDHGTPKGLARALPGHTIITAYARDGDAITLAALLSGRQDGVDVLLTTDRRIRYQQNLAGRRIALVVLTGTTKWSRVRLHLERIAAVVNAATPGSYIEIDIPFS